MRSLLTATIVVVVVTSVSACGDTNGRDAAGAVPQLASNASNSATEPRDVSPPDYTKADADKDSDITAPYDDKNNSGDLDFGHAANSSDEREVAVLVKRYYMIALMGDGAHACPMIVSTLEESIPEDYSQPGGPVYMRGAKSCPVAMTLLFKHFHVLLALQVPQLKVIRVRVLGRHGYAFLSFGSLPERKIIITRERRAWKIGSLLDSELT